MANNTVYGKNSISWKGSTGTFAEVTDTLQSTLIKPDGLTTSGISLLGGDTGASLTVSDGAHTSKVLPEGFFLDGKDITGGSTGLPSSTIYDFEARVKGMTGYFGVTGAAGATGVLGATGLPGEDGIIGVDGATGPQGVTGPQGQAADVMRFRGAIAVDANFPAIGVRLNGDFFTVTGTSVYDSETSQTFYSSDEIIWNATDARWVQVGSSITLVQGDTGAVGDRGATGLVGAQGVTGTVSNASYTRAFSDADLADSRLVITHGLASTSILMAVYSDGREFIPTERVVLDADHALVDLTGHTPLTGAWSVTVLAAGQSSAQGVTGEAGYQGLTGLDGVKGLTGYQGITGSKGIGGDSGPQGSTGVQGEPGATGVAGVTGEMGYTGERGWTGAKGTQGETGVVSNASYTRSFDNSSLVNGVLHVTHGLNSTSIVMAVYCAGAAYSPAEQTVVDADHCDIDLSGSVPLTGAWSVTILAAGQSSAPGITGVQGLTGLSGLQGASVSIVAGYGLTGGGVLTSDRTLSVDSSKAMIDSSGATGSAGQALIKQANGMQLWGTGVTGALSGTGTINKLMKRAATGSTATSDSSLTDDGLTITATIPVVAPGHYTTNSLVIQEIGAQPAPGYAGIWGMGTALDVNTPSFLFNRAGTFSYINGSTNTAMRVGNKDIIICSATSATARVPIDTDVLTTGGVTSSVLSLRNRASDNPSSGTGIAIPFYIGEFGVYQSNPCAKIEVVSTTAVQAFKMKFSVASGTNGVAAELLSLTPSAITASVPLVVQAAKIFKPSFMPELQIQPDTTKSAMLNINNNATTVGLFAFNRDIPAWYDLLLQASTVNINGALSATATAITASVPIILGTNTNGSLSNSNCSGTISAYCQTTWQNEQPANNGYKAVHRYRGWNASGWDYTLASYRTPDGTQIWWEHNLENNGSKFRWSNQSSAMLQLDSTEVTIFSPLNLGGGGYLKSDISGGGSGTEYAPTLIGQQFPTAGQFRSLTHFRLNVSNAYDMSLCGYNTGTTINYYWNMKHASSEFIVANANKNIAVINNGNFILADGVTPSTQTAWTTRSDARHKTDIVDSGLGLDFISKLRPVSYRLKRGTIESKVIGQEPDVIDLVPDENGEMIEKVTKGKVLTEEVVTEGVRPHYGFIAQEVEEALAGQDFAGFIREKNEEGTLALRYEEFIAPMVKAMQEQQALITEQSVTIREQAASLADLQRRLALLEAK